MTCHSSLADLWHSSFQIDSNKTGTKQRLSKSDYSNCGVPRKKIQARRRKRLSKDDGRHLVLRNVLQDGPAWGTSTPELISKTSKKVFKPKRVSAKAAKAAEFESKGEVLSASEATLFRALGRVPTIWQWIGQKLLLPQKSFADLP